MQMINGQPLAAPSRGLGRVGMWGAPSSGKTTFLAALSIAASRKRAENLLLYGADDASTDFLRKETARITSDRRFPPATELERHLSWVMHMNAEVRARKWGLPITVVQPYQLNIDLLDAPGRLYDDTREVTGARSVDEQGTSAHLFDDDDGPAAAPTATADREDEFLDQLASCQGVLLLFDPVREWREGDAFNYFHGTLMKLAQRLMPSRVGRAKLPQYVAVCTTMFDQPDVYRRASTMGYSQPSVVDPHHFPRVKDEYAERFFVDMVKESQRGNADLVRSSLRQFFEEDHVKFFVTSAIGFYLNRQLGIFQESEFSNVEDAEGGKPRIKGPIYPINVIEPLMWLGQRLATEETNHAR